MNTPNLRVAVVLALSLLVFPAVSDAGDIAWCPVEGPPSARISGVAHWVESKLDGAPQPLAHVHTEGTLPHQGIRDESEAAMRQIAQMRDAALVWHEGGDDRFFQFAVQYLQAWADIYQPDFNPIDETNFDGLIDTYALTADRLPPATRERAAHLLRLWAEGYLDRMEANHSTAGTWTNNWQSHRIKLVTMMAAALGDHALFERIRPLFWDQIKRNILPDGMVIDFQQRDALHYVTYDLEPLLQAALAARDFGEDWYHTKTPTGASLQAAVQWLEPYATGQSEHQEFVHTTVNFDRERAAAGLPGYGGPWDTKTAGKLYWLANQFDPSYGALAQKLSPVPPSFVALCGE